MKKSQNTPAGISESVRARDERPVKNRQWRVIRGNGGRALLTVRTLMRIIRSLRIRACIVRREEGVL